MSLVASTTATIAGWLLGTLTGGLVLNRKGNSGSAAPWTSSFLIAARLVIGSVVVLRL